jgi:hypothetical protein
MYECEEAMASHAGAIKRAVRSLLGGPVISDAVWRHFAEQIEEIESGARDSWTVAALKDSEDVQWLAEDVHKLLILVREQYEAGGLPIPDPGDTPIAPVALDGGAVRLSTLHSQRVVAYSMLVAAYAAEHPDVQRFRQRFLSGGLLDQEGARRFLSSPANATLHPRAFEHWGIEPAKHRAEIVDRERFATGLGAVSGEDAREYFLHVLPIKHREPTERAVGDKTVPLCRHEMTIRFTHPHEQLDAPWFEHDFRKECPIGDIHFHEDWPYWPESVLAELKRTIDALCKAYHAWTEPDACGFTLTGGVPRNSPVRTSSHVTLGLPNYAKLTLEVEPWAPESVAMAAYRTARHELCGANTKQQGGEEKGYALVAFICQHADRGWPERFQLWKREYPQWQYTSLDRFKQAWKRGRDLVGFRLWDTVPRIAEHTVNNAQ